MFVVFAVLVGLVPVIPAVIYVMQSGRTNPAKSVARLVNGFNAFNFIVGFMAAGLGLVWLASPTSVLAAGAAQEGLVDQYASLDGRPTHILAIVNHVYDAMNEARSLGTRGSQSGIWLSVKDLHLVDAKIGRSPIFRLPNRGLQWDHVLGEEVVNTIQAHQLTGLVLQEVVVE